MSDEAPSDPRRTDRCLNRYTHAGHSTWCLREAGHEGECGEGAISGRPNVKSTHMPRKR